jgi:Uma2 family endonuclease
MTRPQLDEARRYTIEEYRALPPADDYRFELVAGRLVREPRPGAPHGAAVATLCRHLVAYAERHGGRVLTETGFVLEDDPPTVRGPDVSFMLEDPEPYGGDSDAYPRGAPSLVVEVVSPSNSATAIQQKVLEYFGAGGRRVWVVHPGTRSVVVYRSPSEAMILQQDDDLIDDDLLPDFRLPVRAIFV